MRKYYLILAVSRYGLCCDAPLNQGAGSNDVTSTVAEVFPNIVMAWCSGESPDDCPHGFPVRRESCMARMVCKHGGMERLKMDGPRMPSEKVAPIGHHQRQQISTIQLFESWTSLTIRLVARSGPTSAKTVSGRSFYPTACDDVETSICQPTIFNGMIYVRRSGWKVLETNHAIDVATSTWGRQRAAWCMSVSIKELGLSIVATSTL